MANFFTKLPKTAQISIVVVVLAIIVFVIYKVNKYFKDKKEGSDEKEVVDDSKKALNDSIKNGVQLSFTSNVYSTAANTIEKLLDGCETSGSEIQVIETIIKTVKNKSDWYKLISDFGVRDISVCGTFGMSKDKYDLPTLLNDQLDSVSTYSINVDGYKDYGFVQNTISVLKKYLNTINIVL